MAYTDQVLTCTDCGIDFVFSASEQEFFAQKGFSSAPKRCSSCRAQRRAAGGGSYGNGGELRRERRRDARTAVARARCSTPCAPDAARTPRSRSGPTGARPVYCSDCFRLMRG